MTDPAREATTYAEYLRRLEESEVKLEFIDGEIYATAGGTYEHATIATNVVGLLFAALRGRPCRPFVSDLRVRIDERDSGTYPDVSVICGKPEFSEADSHAPTNPVALFEVSSRSSAEYDRTVKFDLYATLAALRHYVLVYHRSRRVEVFTRPSADGDWTMHRYFPGEAVALDALGCTLPVDEIYEGTEVPDMDPVHHHHLSLLEEGMAEYSPRPAEA